MNDIKTLTRAPRLTLFEFQELQRIFNDAAGLSFDDSALPLFQRRLASRLPLHDLTSYRDYARLLQFGAQAELERNAALDLLTAGETYFFRHKEQLTLLTEKILPALAEQNAGTRRLGIWSAGCSSGEEVYTAAILVHESRLFEGWNVRIIGHDLSHERIEHARQGCYFQGAFRSTDERIKRTYFEETGRIWQVHEEIRRLCQFAPHNLLGKSHESFMGRVDLILCRNVLIYLDERSRARVIENLYERLVPGGFLLLGHSESLKFMHTPLELLSLEQDLAFRKPTRITRRGSDT
jgi:chemotaxis protein methyltransferase CheR